MALTENTQLSQLDSQQIRELQNLLLRAGFDAGPVDGILGQKTISAYQRFLSANGHQYASRGGPPTITKLVADLWSNAVPEYWAGISRGGEVDATATTGGKGNPNPTPAPATSNAGTPGSTPAPAAAAPAETPFTPATDTATEEEVKKRWPHLAYLLGVPEVHAALLKAAGMKASEGELQGLLSGTSWWQTTAATTRLWDQKFAMDNATAMSEWDQRTVAVQNLADQQGVQLDPEGAKWIAGRILREGWSDEQLRRFLGAVARNNGGAAPGQITENQASLKAMARNYLAPLDDATASEYAIRIAEGSMTKEALSSMLRTEAKNRFTWLAPQIDAGLSPMDLFSSTRQAVARQLEIDPETIDLNDPRWSHLTSPVMEGNAQRSMNFAEAQLWARQRPEWRFTDNANTEASQIGLNMLQSMGVIKSGR